jgi:hypothetical protein
MLVLPTKSFLCSTLSQFSTPGKRDLFSDFSENRIARPTTPADFDGAAGSPLPG